jgi:nucleoside-diphosphate-sugar epimerase
LRCIVTGAAGFIGSAICDRLLSEGNEVIGIDSFVDYYPRSWKEKNLEQARQFQTFSFIEDDIASYFDTKPAQKLEGVDAIFHQAAQAGVRASWGQDFSIYVHNNVLATQKLLEACRGRDNLRVIYASSSSVYGEVERFPMREDDTPAPVSPYGVTKLAAEHLARLYSHNFGVPTVSLRYFTVYGPRQRPDMAFHRLLKAILKGEEFGLFGSGDQTRDFTFVEDIVQGNLDAAKSGKPGAIYNLGGGNRVSMNHVIDLAEKVVGRKALIRREGRQSGDVTNTGADTSKAQADFGFKPRVSLEEGLARESRFIEEIVLKAEVAPIR